MLTKLRIVSQDVGIIIFKFRHVIFVCQERGHSFNSSLNYKPFTDKVKKNFTSDRSCKSIIIIIIIIIICPNQITINVGGFGGLEVAC